MKHINFLFRIVFVFVSYAMIIVPMNDMFEMNSLLFFKKWGLWYIIYIAMFLVWTYYIEPKLLKKIK